MSLFRPCIPVQQDGENLAKRTRHSGLYAIVLTPTGELYREIWAVLFTLIHGKHRPHWIFPVTVSSGANRKCQKLQWVERINILVATSQRLLDYRENTESLEPAWAGLCLIKVTGLWSWGLKRLLEVSSACWKRRAICKKGEEAVEWKSEVGSTRRRRMSRVCSATMKTSIQWLRDISLRQALYIDMEKGYDNVGGGNNCGKKGFSVSRTGK